MISLSILFLLIHLLILFYIKIPIKTHINIFLFNFYYYFKILFLFLNFFIAIVFFSVFIFKLIMISYLNFLYSGFFFLVTDVSNWSERELFYKAYAVVQFTLMTLFVILCLYYFKEIKWAIRDIKSRRESGDQSPIFSCFLSVVFRNNPWLESKEFLEGDLVFETARFFFRVFFFCTVLYWSIYFISVLWFKLVFILYIIYIIRHYFKYVLDMFRFFLNYFYIFFCHLTNILLNFLNSQYKFFSCVGCRLIIKLLTRISLSFLNFIIFLIILSAINYIYLSSLLVIMTIILNLQFLMCIFLVQIFFFIIFFYLNIKLLSQPNSYFFFIFDLFQDSN